MCWIRGIEAADYVGRLRMSIFSPRLIVRSGWVEDHGSMGGSTKKLRFCFQRFLAQLDGATEWSACMYQYHGIFMTLRKKSRIEL